MTFCAFDLIADFLADPGHGWSIGSFGAIGEFIRDADERTYSERSSDHLQICTARGGMRVRRHDGLKLVAWDSLSSDGESWGHDLAFCLPHCPSGARVIVDMGRDEDAVRQEDRGDRIFDLGVGSGVVRMGLRTRDKALIEVMEAAEGHGMIGNGGLMAHVLRAQPHRVLLSPLGRIEIFQPIPPPDGKSPEGPHTHLLPKLIVKDRPHSANAPIPDGWQSALTLHPASPWRTALGERKPFDKDMDAAFAPFLKRYGLEEDLAIARILHEAIETGATPEFADWPDSRRGRAKARIELRRRAAAGDRRVIPWRALYDRAAPETEAVDEAQA